MMDIAEASFLQMENIHVVCDYPDVFPSELPGIPPTQGVSFEIKLIPDTMPIHKSPYQMAIKEELELKKKLDDLLSKGFIRPSKSPWAYLVLFMEKRMVVRACVSIIMPLMW
jgi:hypothetical protein